jgi:pimeloyl-ACP methyl ester carboxylesterase
LNPTSRFIVANGLKHHVLEWDGGSRSTVLCLHGFLDLAWGFAPLGPLLAAQGWHVVAPDFRGHGDSDRIGPGGYYHFLDYLFDVEELVPRLVRDRLSIVGHSMGGGIAAFYGATFPERVERMAILEGLGFMEQPGEDVVKRTRDWIVSTQKARARQPRVYPSVEAAADRLQQQDPLCPRPLALLLAEHGTREVSGGRAFKHDPVHITRGPYPFREEHARAFWSRISCPVLHVEGAESPVVELPFLRERYALFQNAKVVRLAGAGHMLIRHQPEALAKELLAFLGPAR